MRTRLASPAAVIAVVLLGWACDGAAGSESDTAASSRRTANVDAEPTVDVCSLLTAEEIAAATGAAIGPTEPSAYGPSQVCNYTQQGQSMPVVSLLLTPNVQNFASSTEMAEWQTKRAKSGMSMGNNGENDTCASTRSWCRVPQDG